MIDFGQWANEEFRVPAKTDASAEEGPGPEMNDEDDDSHQ